MILFENRKDCCGCGACANICPNNAISMKEDEYGFIFPVIDEKICINCHMCQKVCAFQNIDESNLPLKTWVAVTKNKESLKKSASGGVFFTLAKEFVKENNCAVGAAFDDAFNLKHIIAEDIDTLTKLQGSKYTQSNTEFVYREIKIKLNNGKKVLFSGCPCQVAGLKAFLGREYENLITIDLICHGVPSNKSFKDYIAVLQKKNGVQIESFNFRDKRYGWGINGTAFTSDNKNVKALCTSSSYLYYFSHGLTYRENCYKCKYASKNRPSDITIGDYWGIEKEHSELLNKKVIDESKGVSVVIANTQKGIDLVERNAELFYLYESTFEKAARSNAQLNHPIECDPKREDIIELYKISGWNAVEERFNKNIGIKKYSSQIKSLFPASIKRFLKRLK